MSITRLIQKQINLNDPLSLAEDIVATRGWAQERLSETDLLVQVSGAWSVYQLYFVWQEDVQALQFCCQFDFKVANINRPDVHSLLSLINERLWLGHFDVSSEDQTPMFRHNILLRGGDMNQQIEDVIEIGIAECNRFYPAFQFVLWGNKSPEEAVGAALIDPSAGRA